MKKVVINSTKTIMVTSGLQFEDYTIKESDIKDRMKIAPKWAKQLIRQGIHKYPAEVAEWNTVKILQQDGVLTINGFEGDEVKQEEPQAEQTEEPKRRRRKVEDVSLEEVAGE